MNIAELQKELFSGDTVKVANAHARLVGIEVEKIVKVVNDTLHKKMIDSITFGAFIEVLKEYEGIEIDRKTLFDILRKLNILDANNNPTKRSEDYCIFVDFLDYFETPFGGVETKERRITPFGQIYLTNKIIDYCRDNKIIKNEEERERKKEEIYSFCNSQYCPECAIKGVADMGGYPWSCAIDLRKVGSRELPDDEIDDYYKAIEKYRAEQEEKKKAGESAKEKQIARELKDKQKEIISFCEECYSCSDCIFDDIAEFKDRNGNRMCKVNKARYSIKKLSEDEINEYYEVLEKYKKQEEKEVSVDDMRDALQAYCCEQPASSCDEGFCILSEFRDCPCSDETSDDEVRRRYNIVMNSKEAEE